MLTQLLLSIQEFVVNLIHSEEIPSFTFQFFQLILNFLFQFLLKFLFPLFPLFFLRITLVVSLAVSSQIGTLGKPLVAVGKLTLEGFLTSMSPHVRSKIEI